MKNFFLLVIGIIFSIISIAQDKPVQFFFKTERTGKDVAVLSIMAKIKAGVQLYSIQKKSADDAFFTSINFDSTARKFIKDSLQEIGNLKTSVDSLAGGITVTYYTDSVKWLQTFSIADADSTIIKGTISWLAKVGGDNYENAEETIIQKISAKTVENKTSNETNRVSYWSTFLICLLTGILAVFTPCVFPLIPVTVSFFLKRSKNKGEGIRNSLWYSISIILIYTIPTLILTLIFGDTVLYTISTHPVSNIMFFVIFIIFAISFFGAFELTLPHKWANKTDEQAGKGGMTGIFFMALTLVIVSFSCTGPIVGTLLGQTSTEGVSIAPVIGMLGFGIGLAFPFSLFAFFPSMLQSLPKSGGWLNTVKVTFGFIELALAMKFLSNVDLAYHWRLLDREIFIIIWIIIFLLLGFYLLGKLKFSHDTDLPYITVPRLFFAMASFSFALYLFPGLWGAPLKAIGGWLPHTGTQDFNLQEIQYKLDNIKWPGGSGATTTTTTSLAQPPKKYTDKLHVPLGLTAYFDLEEGMAAAKALNKPVMLDFTGHSCANCRKMEAEVWADPVVLRIIKEDFVLVSLYVDESTELPDAEQYTNNNGDRITKVGEKNLDYEITKFGFNAQPLYMFLDLTGKPLSVIKYGYDSDKQKFINHLQTVKEEFQKRNK